MYTIFEKLFTLVVSDGLETKTVYNFQNVVYIRCFEIVYISSRETKNVDIFFKLR